MMHRFHHPFHFVYPLCLLRSRGSQILGWRPAGIAMSHGEGKIFFSAWLRFAFQCV